MLFRQPRVGEDAQKFSGFKTRAAMLRNHLSTLISVFPVAEDADRLAVESGVTVQIFHQPAHLFVGRTAPHQAIANDAVNERRMDFSPPEVSDPHCFNCAARRPVEKAA